MSVTPFTATASTASRDPRAAASSGARSTLGARVIARRAARSQEESAHHRGMKTRRSRILLQRLGTLGRKAHSSLYRLLKTAASA